MALRAARDRLCAAHSLRTVASVDATLRELDRRWRANPGDLDALETAVAAYRRSGLAAPVELLDTIMAVFRLAGVRVRADLLAAHPRWERLVGFIRVWGDRPFTEADGEAPDRIAHAEAKLGRMLPLAVREWYELVGRRLDVSGRSHGFPLTALALDGLRVDENDGLLVLCDECQGVFSWGVAPGHMALVDPPVVARAWEGGDHVIVNTTVSEFFLFIALFLKANDRDLYGYMRDGVEAIAHTWPRSSLPAWWWGDPEAFTLFGDADTLICWDSTGHVSIAGRTDAARARARAVLDPHVQWLM